MNLEWRSVSRGLFLITLGVLFLLMNLGLLPWTFWLDLGYWWPVLLVVLGIGVLLKRHVPFSFVLLVSLLLVLALSLTGWGRGLQDRLGGMAPTSRFIQSYALPEGASEARVIIDAGAVNLKLDGSSSGLADVDLAQPAAWGEGARVSSELQEGGTAVLRVSQSAAHTAFMPGPRSLDWTVRLTDRVPVNLKLDVGAIKADLDLSLVKLQRFELKGGAGDIHVKFGVPSGKVPVSVDAAASRVVLAVPGGVPVRVTTEGVLGSVKGLSDPTNAAGDGSVATPDFGSSDRGLDIAVHGAVADVRLERY